MENKLRNTKVIDGGYESLWFIVQVCTVVEAFIRHSCLKMTDSSNPQ